MVFANMIVDGPQAKPMIYKGISFRSQLEGKMAQTFDIFCIEWQYEPMKYHLSNGLWYMPDFWLPYAKQFVECKGGQSPEAMGKAYGLALDTECPVLVIGYDWAKLFQYEWNITPSGVNDEFDDEPTVACYSSGLALAGCAKCGKRWFLAQEDTWACHCCGDHGAKPIMLEFNGLTSLFDSGQKIAASKYEKYCD